MLKFLILLLITVSLTAKENHFYFVQITDTHWGKEGNIENTQKIVQAINALPMDISCVIHTGDIMDENIENSALVDSGLSVLSRLKMPIHFAAGNNDIINKKSVKIYENRFGNQISAAEYNGVTFIMMNTEPLRTGKSIKGYDPLKELEITLKLVEGKEVIIAHHASSVEDFYANKMHESWDTEIAQKWQDLLNKYNVTAVLAGHFHRSEQHWLGDVPLCVSASVDGSWGRQPSFRIFEFRDGKLGFRTQYLK